MAVMMKADTRPISRGSNEGDSWTITVSPPTWRWEGVSLEGGGASDVEGSPLKVLLSPFLEDAVWFRVAGFVGSGVCGERDWLEGLMEAGCVALMSTGAV